jgi:poly(3-hydroxybutyrate) depolymerase
MGRDLHRLWTLPPLAALAVLMMVEAPAGAEAPRGQVLRRTYDFKAAGRQMEYALYVPRTPAPASGFPLIVALHGFLSNPQQIVRYPGFTAAAEQHGYLIVAPMGYNARGWYGSQGAGNQLPGAGFRGDPRNLGALSELDVMNVLDLMRREFCIDPNRIYLLGHSMGGGGAVYLATKYPQIWAGTATIAPALMGKTHPLEQARHIPSLVIQGDRDILVPVGGTRRLIRQMKKVGITHQYIEVRGGDHLFIAFRYFREIFAFFNRSPRKPVEAPPEPAAGGIE